MSELFCSCATGQPNLGQPGCIDSFSRDLRLIFMAIRATDGTFNQIIEGDFTAGVLPESFIEDKINETDESKKWSITEVLKTPTPERDDPITQEVDNINKIVSQGNLNYSAMFFGGVASPQYETKLNSLSCKKVGFMSVDVAGNIKGKFVDDGTGVFVFRPRRIESNTLNAKYKEPTATELQSIALTMTVAQTEIDGNLRFIPTSKIGTDMTDIPGVIDVVITVSNITTTTIDMNMVFDYGGAFALQPHIGVVDADVVLFNNTDVAVVVMAVVENDDEGNYTGTFDDVDVDPGDDMQVSLSQTNFESNIETFIGV